MQWRWAGEVRRRGQARRRREVERRWEAVAAAREDGSWAGGSETARQAQRGGQHGETADGDAGRGAKDN